ncbi:LEAF RUST 10 DISEASE-RESISTANCE LOCUS RECEPTOR-LIKE PROTEIN KINASE-like 1.2 [Olea europaea var. sylvestris]|uniref:LEAF RUST 10 DISEASE-RESISTANCE LOCUS RECEPTOR-LIKE PROTEIN KINASE-like 1.2 n=1 Tax=Olea europaea var. sylvestris TaxID=158386 RepID=UPI000C1CED1E|nr:LEAF RUST 10 DISEASE-RESISTANCE LOCUS RECEPTOR-LIKE PROTEIN KINASE-like 1.2 [Olea europaea var. sylvestris]
MKQNMYTFLISFELCIFCIILVAKQSFCVDYRYEACVPKSCGNGPNISFPFYIHDKQESYCGFPGFELNCTNSGYPVLHLQGKDVMVQNISYETRILRVYDAAVSSSNGSCFSQIKNTTLPEKFNYVNVSYLYLLSNCTGNLSEDLSRHRIGCGNQSRDNWGLAVFEGNENFKNALGNCEQKVVAPVELHGGEERNGTRNYMEILRRGVALNWTASDCNVCAKSRGRCGFDATVYQFKCFCPDRPHSSSCKPEKIKMRPSLRLILATAIPGGVIILLLLFSFIIWCLKRTYDARNISSDPSTKSIIEGGNLCFGIPIFSYTELKEATNNFDSLKELGDGGFGTVYHGKLHDGREVAIKRLYEHNYKRVEQFMNEIKILTCLRHRNLVSLYGCTSTRSRELLLVYEYIPNGTVADHLYGDTAKEAPLKWPVRLNIAIETAQALAYLHASDIIHRDVKTTNILLDDNFCVKVADFGLSRLSPTDVTHISTAPQGTPGYVDPEYHESYQLTNKSDVYSFGVVLIELISSMPAVDISRSRHEINLANLAVNKIQRSAFNELIDPSLGFEFDDEVRRMTTSVAELAFQCLQLEKETRPKMDEVLHILKEIRAEDEFDVDKTKENIDDYSVPRIKKIPPSPESEGAVLLKNKFQESPNCVTDTWYSASSGNSSSF